MQLDRLEGSPPREKKVTTATSTGSSSDSMHSELATEHPGGNQGGSQVDGSPGRRRVNVGGSHSPGYSASRSVMANEALFIPVPRLSKQMYASTIEYG